MAAPTRPTRGAGNTSNLSVPPNYNGRPNPTSRSADVRRQLFRTGHTHTQSSSAVPQASSASSNFVNSRSRSYAAAAPTPFDDDPDDVDDVVVRGKDGNYDLSLEGPLQMMMMLLPQMANDKEGTFDTDTILSASLTAAQRELAKKQPAVVEAVRAANRAMVASLEEDNWMYEPDEDDSKF